MLDCSLCFRKEKKWFSATLVRSSLSCVLLGVPCPTGLQQEGQIAAPCSRVSTFLDLPLQDCCEVQGLFDCTSPLLTSQEINLTCDFEFLTLKQLKAPTSCLIAWGAGSSSTWQRRRLWVEAFLQPGSLEAAPLTDFLPWVNPVGHCSTGPA